MRPATDEDDQVIHELLHARNNWSRRRGQLPPDSIALRVLIGNTGDHMALMTAWIHTWNENPRPFTWTKTADEILNSLADYLTKVGTTDQKTEQN